RREEHRRCGPGRARAAAGRVRDRDRAPRVPGDRYVRHVARRSRQARIGGAGRVRLPPGGDHPRPRSAAADLSGDGGVRSLRPEGLSGGGDRPGGGPPAGVRLATPPVPPSPPSTLSGPVDVCVAVPRLELDRPFTYVLPDDSEAGLGSMVSVKFHGRTVKG